MQLFTLRYSTSLGGFDPEPLERFARDKEVLSFREHFFTVNDVPHLACVLTWQEALSAGDEPPRARERRTSISKGSSREERPDPAAELDERGRALFDALRSWRARAAHEEGVPPYLLFTNRQLVEIVRHCPENATALGHVEGIGAGKVKRYGTALLALLHPAPAENRMARCAAPRAIGASEVSE